MALAYGVIYKVARRANFARALPSRVLVLAGDTGDTGAGRLVSVIEFAAAVPTTSASMFACDNG